MISFYSSTLPTVTVSSYSKPPRKSSSCIIRKTITVSHSHRRLSSIQATTLQDDEEKIVVEETFRPKSFPYEPNGSHGVPPDSKPSSSIERWFIKFEQSINIFLTDTSIKILDIFYHDRDYPRFFVLETIARIPYIAFTSVLHMYESFGWWRRADYLKVHFAESWNEMHHLLIMEELGGNALWFDRFIAQFIAIFYYFMMVFMYGLSPRMAYHFSECVENHAFETYDKFLKAKGDELKEQAPSKVAVTQGDMYLFENVLKNIRDVKHMGGFALLIAKTLVVKMI